MSNQQKWWQQLHTLGLRFYCFVPNYFWLASWTIGAAILICILGLLGGGSGGWHLKNPSPALGTILHIITLIYIQNKNYTSLQAAGWSVQPKHPENVHILTWRGKIGSSWALYVFCATNHFIDHWFIDQIIVWSAWYEHGITHHMPKIIR